MWALARSVAGLVGLVLVPYVVYRLCPPDVRDTSAAQTLAAERLRGMGPIARRERAMIGDLRDGAAALAVGRVAWVLADNRRLLGLTLLL